jgi:hypothetical protein
MTSEYLRTDDAEKFIWYAGFSVSELIEGLIADGVVDFDLTKDDYLVVYTVRDGGTPFQSPVVLSTILGAHKRACKTAHFRVIERDFYSGNATISSEKIAWLLEEVRSLDPNLRT